MTKMFQKKIDSTFDRGINVNQNKWIVAAFTVIIMTTDLSDMTVAHKGC